MAYIPHTENDITAMLNALKLNSIDDLFSESNPIKVKKVTKLAIIAIKES